MSTRHFWARVQALFGRRRADAEMTRELDSHSALIEEDLARQGLSEQAARREARLRLGSTDALAERHREARSFAWLEQLLRDLRIGIRSLRRAPAFTLTAILTLALGLGAVITVFTVVNSVLLEPLPYPGAGQLVALRQMAPGGGGIANLADGLGLSRSMYVTYTQHNHSFTSMGIWDAGDATVTGRGQPERVKTVEISDGVLQSLAVPPLLGRRFEATDFVPHQASTVMLSYGFWQRHFGGAATAVGATLDVDGNPRVIVGVMPAGFRVVENDADLLLPMAFEPVGLKLAGFGYNGIARLSPGATLRSADADMSRLLEVWMHSWTNCPKCSPLVYRSWHITPALRPLKNDVVGGVSGVLWVVMATIGLVMLIAAGNVANLFLVRGEARQHELAVRAALGAGRRRIAQSLLVESALIAAAGCALGLTLAQAAVLWLRALGPANLPRLSEIAINARVLGFAVLVALAAALVAGLAPLLHRNTALAPTLSSESRSASGSRHRRRVRSALTVLQMSLALMLLLAAGLLLRTFANLTAVHPGFSQPQTVQTFRLSLPTLEAPTDLQVMRTENNILDRLAALPGVSAVGLADQAPMQDYGADWDIMVKQGSSDFSQNSSPPTRSFAYISPGYLGAMGTRLVAGRDFSWNDIYALRHDILISENLAREFWGSAAAAIGQQASASGAGNWYQVIGVVEDVHSNGVGKPAPTMVYWPALTPALWGNPTAARRDVTVVLRTSQAGIAALQQSVRQAVRAQDPQLPIAAYQTMQQIYDHALAVPSFTMVMLALAGIMALVIGLIGIYGVLAYEVAQRRREIGIRLALGSSRSAVRRIFVRQGLTLALIGGAIGWLGAAGLSGALRSLLYGVSPFDPLTFAAAPALLLLTVLMASYLPARRASALEAASVLRD